MPQKNGSGRPEGPAVFRVLPAGDGCCLVLLGTDISDQCSNRVHLLRYALDALRPPWVRDLVPGYCTLGVVFDPLQASFSDACTLVRRGMARATAAQAPGRTVVLPVCYGGAFGPDLDAVCRTAGLSEREVLARHTAPTYRCAMLGFLPGFPYLAGLDPQLATPRLATPRTVIPAGAVGIAGGQTGVYPMSSPGGWNLIGRTPLQLFDVHRQPPALIAPGDHVRFAAITPDEFQRTRERLSTSYQQISTICGKLPGMTVRQAGLLTTVQDAGRWGCQDLGVPVSGAMDPQALALGNLLVGNDPGAAALELTVTGPELIFDTDALIAMTGADLQMTCNGIPVAPWTACLIHTGDVVSFGTAPTGCRAWLCVAGGIDLPPVLKSRSTLLRAGFGGLDGRALRTGDTLPLRPPAAAVRALEGYVCPPELRTPGATDTPIPVLPGPQQQALTPAAQERFLTTAWQVTAGTDRMGCRLDGPALQLAGSADIISEYVPAGAVQITGSGRPILLLSDCQTTGGYIKPFIVASAALGRLAQLQPGDTVRFRRCAPQEAQALLVKQQQDRLQLVRLRPAQRISHPGGTLVLVLQGIRHVVTWEERTEEGTDGQTH